MRVVLRLGMHSLRVRSVVRKPTTRTHLDPDDTDPTAPAAIRNGMEVSLQMWDEPQGEWKYTGVMQQLSLI